MPRQRESDLSDRGTAFVSQNSTVPPMSWREFAFFLAGLALGFTLGWPSLVEGLAALRAAIGG